ncbi:MAG: hypothetical protein Q4F60_01150 [Candidatus Saccharibacteria bacterium]|nr:hypothetical protein [Candidatus Saccharibacteria bacterium]
MFEITSKNQDEITITAKQTSVTFNVAQNEIDAGLEVGKVHGPGEFEIGDMTIRGVDVAAVGKDEEKKTTEKKKGETIYVAEIGGVHVAIIGDDEKALDEVPQGCILCTTSVRAVREVEPKIVVAMGNVDGMVTELKLSARTEKKLKIKNASSLPMSLEVVALT